MSSNIDVEKLLTMLSGAHSHPSLASRLLAPLFCLSEHPIVIITFGFLFYTFCGVEMRRFLRATISGIIAYIKDKYVKAMKCLTGFSSYTEFLDHYKISADAIGVYLDSERTNKDKATLYNKLHNISLEETSMRFSTLSQTFQSDADRTPSPLPSTSVVDHSEQSKLYADATIRLPQSQSSNLNLSSSSTESLSTFELSLEDSSKTVSEFDKLRKEFSDKAEALPEDRKVIIQNKIAEIRKEMRELLPPPKICTKESSSSDSDIYKPAEIKIDSSLDSWDRTSNTDHIIYSKKTATGVHYKIKDKDGVDCTLSITEENGDTLPNVKNLATQALNKVHTAATAVAVAGVNIGENIQDGVVYLRDRAREVPGLLGNAKDHVTEAVKNVIHHEPVKFDDMEDEDEDVVIVANVDPAAVIGGVAPMHPIQSQIHPVLQAPHIARATNDKSIRKEVVQKVVESESLHARVQEQFARHFQDFRIHPTKLSAHIRAGLNQCLVYCANVKCTLKWLRQVLSPTHLSQIIQSGVSHLSELILTFLLRILMSIPHLLMKSFSSMTNLTIQLMSWILSLEPKNLIIILLTCYALWTWRMKYLIAELLLKTILKNKMLSIALLEWGTTRGYVARRLLLNSLIPTLEYH